MLKSWLHALTSIRNICAHHSRLWNRELGIRPELPAAPDFAWPHHLLQPATTHACSRCCASWRSCCDRSAPIPAGARLLDHLNEFRQLDTRQMASQRTGRPTRSGHKPFLTREPISHANRSSNS
nr:Abi family protein [Xanthomonas oryzae]